VSRPSLALDGPRAKLDRVDVQRDALYDEFSAFVNRKTRRIAHGPDLQTGDYVFWVEVTEEVPALRWGTLIGEVVHNLRSALEQAVWHLSVVNLGRDPTDDEAKGIHFPAARSKDDFKSLIVLRYLDPTYIKTLRRFQPYHRGHDPAGHPLAVLARLSNHDKHRIIQTTVTALRDFRVKIEAHDCEILDVLRLPPGIALEQGAELARVRGRTTGPNPQIEGKANLTGYIAFTDAEGVLETLDGIRTVAREVFDALEGGT
jgi:hypothetical protein